MSGLDVVLVHAFPLHRKMWAHQEGALAAAGHRVLVPDLRGFGEDRRALPPGPDLNVFADDIASLLDVEGIERAVIGGLSLGGYVAMALLRRHPERVSGLILADTRAGADSDEARENRLSFASRAATEGAAWIPDAMVPNLLASASVRDQDLVRAVTSWITDAAPEAVSWTQRAMAARPDSFGVLRGFAGPALVIVGVEDRMTPVAEAVEMARALDDSALAILPDAGHLSAMEQPEAVSVIISRWLRDQEGALAT